MDELTQEQKDLMFKKIKAIDRKYNTEKPKPFKGIKYVINQILKTQNKDFNYLKEIGYMEVTNDPFMALHINYLGKECGLDKYSVAHNFLQNGDLMKDPDMMFYDIDNKFLASSFEQDAFPVSEFSIECIDNQFRKKPRLQIKHQAFSNQWASNLKEQGFTKKSKIKVDFD